MAEGNTARSFNWRKSGSVMLGMALFIVLCVFILAQLPSLFPRWLRRAEIKFAVRETFPHLCAGGLVIEDCGRGGCSYDPPPGAEWYEVSCAGEESTFGPAFTLDATTCQVTIRSLTLASSLLMDIPANWNGKLRACPDSRPLSVTPAG